MADPILDEIWRVREALLKKHGGLDGYFKYIQKLERARQQRERRRTDSKGRRRKARKSQ